MKLKTRRVIAFITCVVTLVSAMTVGLSANERKVNFPAGSADVAIYMDSKQVLADDSAIINSTTYVSLRAFCDLIGGCDIKWNDATKTATVKKGVLTVTVTNGDLYIYARGRCFYTVQRIRIIDDRICVPIRPLAKAFGVEVDWDGARRAVVLKNTGKVIESGDTFYDADDLYWLSRIISAEAKGESLLGQIAVGNVVLNRVASKNYPNTIYGVIFDRKGGTQFSPVSFGTIYQKPTASSIIAAKICLEGYSISDKVLFFMNPRIATNNWISKNRPFEFTIGNHDFYS